MTTTNWVRVFNAKECRYFQAGQRVKLGIEDTRLRNFSLHIEADPTDPADWVIVDDSGGYQFDSMFENGDVFVEVQTYMDDANADS